MVDLVEKLFAKAPPPLPKPEPNMQSMKDYAQFMKEDTERFMQGNKQPKGKEKTPVPFDKFLMKENSVKQPKQIKQFDEFLMKENKIKAPK
jgi:hypothetical protein